MMTLSSSVRAVVAAVMLLAVSGVPSPGVRAQAPGQIPTVEEALSQARRLFDALDYEAAVPALDRAITLMESSRPSNCARGRTSASAPSIRLGPTSAACLRSTRPTPCREACPRGS
jgi:hypothetical protein